MKKTFARLYLIIIIFGAHAGFTFSQQAFSWSQLIAEGEIVASSSKEVEILGRFAMQHYLTVIIEKRLFFCVQTYQEFTSVDDLTPSSTVGCIESE
ncbi:hypothetical protein N8Z26_03480 [Burkholderiales bacterium]|nr:hypothetical protein [Burkholderiales bacterium]